MQPQPEETALAGSDWRELMNLNAYVWLAPRNQVWSMTSDRVPGGTIWTCLAIRRLTLMRDVRQGERRRT